MRNAIAIAVWYWTASITVSFSIGADPPRAQPSLLITTQSRRENVSIVAADAQGNWTFKSAEDISDQVVQARQVVRWGGFANAEGGHRVRLVAGGEIVAYSVEISDRDVTLESDLLDAIKLPRSAVAAVIFDMLTDDDNSRAIEKRLDPVDREQDTLLLANGDRLAGELVGLTGDKLTLKAADADFVVDRSRATGVVFSLRRSVGGPPAARTKPNDARQGTWIGLRDGSRLFSEKLVLKENQATIELAGQTAVSVARDALTALQPIGGETVYLSDRDDAGYRHIPFLSLGWDYRRDRNATGGPLTVGGRPYLKGLGMHSAARITYNLDAQYRAFQSELAIDDSTGASGSVTCRVFVDDGGGKWQLKYESPVIRGGDKPLSVNVDLAGAKRVSLLVDFADRGDLLDHINWLDARLVK